MPHRGALQCNLDCGDRDRAVVSAVTSSMSANSAVWTAWPGFISVVERMARAHFSSRPHGPLSCDRSVEVNGLDITAGIVSIFEKQPAVARKSGKHSGKGVAVRSVGMYWQSGFYRQAIHAPAR